MIGIVVWLVLGYGVGGVLGLGLVELFSANSHDKSVEAVMTAAFVTGPAGAVLGTIIGFVRRARRRNGAAENRPYRNQP